MDYMGITLLKILQLLQNLRSWDPRFWEILRKGNISSKNQCILGTIQEGNHYVLPFLSYVHIPSTQEHRAYAMYHDGKLHVQLVEPPCT